MERDEADAVYSARLDQQFHHSARQAPHHLPRRACHDFDHTS
jgi:hypothetical protein